MTRASTLILVIAALLQSCSDSIIGTGLSDNETFEINKNLKIVQTSRDIFGLVDGEGFSIIYGNLISAGIDRNGEYLAVEFRPFGATEGGRVEARNDGSSYVIVNVRTGKAEKMADRIERPRLYPIKRFVGMLNSREQAN